MRGILILIAIILISLLHAIPKIQSTEDEFDWRDLIDWNQFDPNQEEIERHSIQSYEQVSNSQQTQVPNTSNIPHNHDHLTFTKPRKERLKETKESQKLYRRKHYHESIKLNPERYENYKKSRRNIDKRNRIKRKEFLSSLPENERNFEINKRKQIIHERYIRSRDKLGKQSRTGTLIKLVKENKATEDDLKELEKRRQNSRSHSMKHRLKRQAEN